MAVYQWRIPNVPVPAQEAGEYLTALEKERGELTPELVLDESRDEGALLHDCFEWDDDKAAYNYRKYQARQLINNIVVVSVSESMPTAPVRAFVSVNKGASSRSSYVSIDIAMSEAHLRAQVLQDAYNELSSFQRKYSSYLELREVFSAINDFGKKIGR